MITIAMVMVILMSMMMLLLLLLLMMMMMMTYQCPIATTSCTKPANNSPTHRPTHFLPHLRYPCSRGSNLSFDLL